MARLGETNMIRRKFQQEEMEQRKDLLSDSIKILNIEKKFKSRRLTDNPSTLKS